MNKTLIFFLLITVLSLNLAAQNTTSSLEFIQNKGQWDPAVTYKGVLSSGAIFLRKTGFTFVQHNPGDMKKLAESLHGDLHNDEAGSAGKPVRRPDRYKKTDVIPRDNNTTPSGDLILRSHAYNMDFAGANLQATQVAEKPEPGYNNYFIGNDPSKWASDCGLFQVIVYKDIYPGIDVKYYTEQGALKYEFLVHPGADPSQIAMKFSGVDKLSIRKSELIISTSAGEIKELAPYTYQSGVDGREKIECSYKLEKDNTVRFILREYDPARALIIDPTLIFASLSGSKADNWGYTATYGPDGTFFAGGIVFNTGYPVSTGAFQTNYRGGGFDMGIMKLSANGAQRLYATYIGGSGEDQPHSLFADQQGNLVIAGRTSSDSKSPSTDYPSTVKFGTLGGTDIVVTKLNATGTAIIGSARIGGSGDDGLNVRNSHKDGPSELVNNYGDDARSEVILDNAGNIYLASCTQSTNFPTTAAASQTGLNGKQDAVLIKLNPNCSNLLFSTYMGGSGYEAGFVLALNPSNQDIYMAGATTSINDLPGNKTNSKQATSAGAIDGYIAVYSNDGSAFRQSTYIGTNGLDFIFGIQFDKNGFPYIMGTTTGKWPVINAKYSNPNSMQFICKLNKDLSGFQYSTVFGSGSSSPNISPVAFLVDRCENVYVSGWGRDIIEMYNLSGTRGMPITRDAYQPGTDNQDFYFFVLKRNAEDILYGTYFGQTGGTGEHVDGGTSRFDQNGVIYQAICANCGGARDNTPWPVTAGAWCCSPPFAPSSGPGCNLGALKISFNFAGVGSKVRPYIDGKLDSTACVPATITFRDEIRNAVSYEWNFGDGTPDVINKSFEITHTFSALGIYRVRLIAVDSSSCNIRDTSYVNVSVKDNKANLLWSYTKTKPCPDLSLEYTFINNSTPRPFTDTSFVWDFGDGTRTPNVGLQNQNHTYATAGTYPVRLILVDTSYCNSPDSLEINVRVSPLVRAQFEIPSEECAPYVAVFNNTSLAGQSFVWDFGDGTPVSNDINPVHTYMNAGTYTIRLTATDPLTCNLTHDTTMQIKLDPKPVASFTYSPVTPVENTPNLFTNNSSPDAIRFKWMFGDGDSLITTSRAPIEHQYNRTFTYQACLTAYNSFGCADDTCQSVSVIVSPKLDVPNAFTPLGPEGARIVHVRGFAINQIRWIIYNRQGQKVFETTDRTQGWDGRYKGVIQPMDVYVYTLEVQFTDNTSTTKKGDITLIR